jgi:hypothetical protein
VGKVTATGRLIPATTGGVFRVFDALRRLSGEGDGAKSELVLRCMSCILGPWVVSE